MYIEPSLKAELQLFISLLLLIKIIQHVRQILDEIAMQIREANH